MRVPAITLFGWGLRVTWSVLFLLGLLSTPHSDLVLRLAVFLLLGVLTPLAYWRFDSLGYALLACLVAAVATGWTYLDLAEKIVLVLVGFIAGLNARYDRQTSPLKRARIPDKGN